VGFLTWKHHCPGLATMLWLWQSFGFLVGFGEHAMKQTPTSTHADLHLGFDYQMASDPASNCCQWHNRDYLAQICVSSSVPRASCQAQLSEQVGLVAWCFAPFYRFPFVSLAAFTHPSRWQDSRLATDAIQVNICLCHRQRNNNYTQCLHAVIRDAYLRRAISKPHAFSAWPPHLNCPG